MDMVKQFCKLRDHCRKFPVGDNQEAAESVRLALEGVTIAAEIVARVPDGACAGAMIEASAGMVVALTTAVEVVCEMGHTLIALRRRAQAFHAALALSDLKGGLRNG